MGDSRITHENLSDTFKNCYLNSTGVCGAENESKPVNDLNSPISSTDASTTNSLSENEESDSKENESNDAENSVNNYSEKEDGIILDTFDITPENNGGVMKQIVQHGEGDEFPGYGDRVIVHYTGWLLNREKPIMFDSSRKEEKCEFSLGKGMVIKGWDLGIATMKKGEVALFICQPQYAYGEMGSPPAIPPHTTLLFEVELFEWKLEDLTVKKDSGILRKVLDKGEGTNFPNEGAQVKVKLVGYFDENIFEEREVEFILGEGCNINIPEGLEIALLKFKLNEKSIIYIHSKYAFDVICIPEYDVSSEAHLKYEVTLLYFVKAKEVWEMNSDEKLQNAKLAKEKGVSYFKENNCKIAVKQFKLITTYLENEPGVITSDVESRNALLLSGHLNIALCHLKLNNFIDAIKSCDKALIMDPNNEKALFRRGQARMYINDCEEALQDFEKICLSNPDNKAAGNCVILCQEKIKSQKLKDKSVYNKMFEKFVKQDEEKLKNMKTETGVWDDEAERSTDFYTSETQRLIASNDSALRDANIIELSNTAHS